MLRLIARGESNSGVSAKLVISESTVKFHVLNLLRKLHVSNRAAAVAEITGWSWSTVGAPRRANDPGPAA